MDGTTEQSKSWSSAQAYSLAVICLLLGVAAGYLLHAPKRPSANAPAAAATGGMQGTMPSADQMKHMADKAAESTVAALQKDPNNVELLTKAGTTYFRAHQFAEATQYYERAVKVKPTAAGYVSLSNSYHYAGDDNRAVETLNQALQLDPKSPDALFNLGMLDWQVKNDPKAAIDAWQRLLKSNPDHPRRAQVENMIAKAKQHLNMPAQAKPAM